MNLRQDKFSPESPEVKFKFRIGDRVMIKGKILGVISYTATHNNQNIYVIRLDFAFHLGVKSPDKDISLLKPIDLSIQEITISDESMISLAPTPNKKFPHINITPTVINMQGFTNSTGPH